jgi:hypothetical protein
MSVNSFILNTFVLASLLLNINSFTHASALRSEADKVTYRLNGSGKEPVFPFVQQGLSGTEATHTWTEGHDVFFAIPSHINNRRCERIVFENVSAHLAHDYDQTVEVYINNEFLQGFTFSTKNPLQHIDIPIPETLDAETYIAFFLPYACTPGLFDQKNKDPRVLALALKTADIFLEKLPQDPNLTFDTVNMGTDQIQPLHFVNGFDKGEGNHRWLNGKRAEFTVPAEIDGRRITAVSFDTVGMVSNKVSQKLIVSGRGIKSQEFNYNPNTPSQLITIELNAEQKSIYQIKFEMPNACLARVVDPKNMDPRELSVSLQSATFSYVSAAEHVPPSMPFAAPRFIPPAQWFNVVQKGRYDYYYTNYMGIIGADKLQSITQGENSKVIIVDFGIDITHPALVNHLTATTKARDHVVNSHGTHISGIVATIAPKAAIEFYSTSNSDLVTRLREAATMPGDVVTLSVGPAEDDPQGVVFHPETVNALEAIVKSGKAITFAFGNSFDGPNGKLNSERTIELAKNPRMLGRLRLVGNIDYDAHQHEGLASASCRAVTQSPHTICAPGSNLYSSYTKKGYQSISGTSYAAPMVAAAIAVLKSAIPGITIDRCLWLLDNSARKINRQGKPLDFTYGNGILDVWSAYQLHQMTKQ